VTALRVLLASAASSAALAAFCAPSLAQAPLVDLLDPAQQGAVSSADPFVLERVRIEIATPRERWFEGELLEADVQVWLETEFARTNLLQISPRQLDAPIQIEAEWLKLAAPPGRSATLALGERVVEAERLAEREFDGRTFVGFALHGRRLIERDGEVVLSAPRVRLAYATRFESTLLDDRAPVDGRIVEVDGAPRTVVVERLPDEGRPVDFAGAVGRFEVAAMLSTRELKDGETFRLTLEIYGEGNFGHFELPRLDRLAGFHSYGRVAAPSDHGWKVVYDMMVDSPSESQFPALAFAYFSPRDAAYRVASTTPIPIRVQGDRRAELSSYEAPPSPAHGRGFAARGSLIVLAISMALAAALVGALIWRLVRRSERRSER